jgi:AraC family transcriptional regulator
MPTKTTTLHDYGRRVARAMAHIAANLDRAQSLEELASVAAFSPYHFHRVYREVAGETPAETLARGRLSRAAAELLKTRQPIARIARRAGYGSAAAFTRAFRAAHGVPPGAYRARGGLGGMPPRPGAPSPEGATVFEVTIREEKPLRLAGIRHIGPFDGVLAAFDRLMAWAGPRGLIGPGTRRIGLFHDDPGSVPASALCSDACLTVPDGVAGEGEVAIREIPAGRFAVLRFRGPYAELEGAYAWLYGTWLPESGEEPEDLPAMEDYLNDCRTLPPSEWLTEVMIPLWSRRPPSAGG